MEEQKIYRLFIAPQTHIRSTQAENWMFAQGVTDEYLLKFGKKKFDERVAKGSKNPGSANNYYNRKKYLQKYWDYKVKLKALFLDCGLKTYPTNNVWFKFFIPMPKSWSQKKRNAHCFEKHESKPDAGNLHKAIEDACCIEDKKNWDYRASKFWYDGEGHIEIIVGALPEPKGYAAYTREDKIK